MTKIDDRYLKKNLKDLPEHIPSVFLFHTPPMGKHGDKIDIRLEITEKFSDDTPLMVELLNQEGDLLIDPIPINFPNLTASFKIPQNIEQGIYILKITYNDCTLESTTFNIVDAESAQEVAEFDKGLEIEDKVSQAIEEGDYNQASNLQEKAERHFINANNPELAGYSWEKLAELLSDKNQILLQKTLEKAWVIYSSLEELENQEEILKRIRHKIESHQLIGNVRQFTKLSDWLKNNILGGWSQDLIPVGDFVTKIAAGKTYTFTINSESRSETHKLDLIIEVKQDENIKDKLTIISKVFPTDDHEFLPSGLKLQVLYQDKLFSEDQAGNESMLIGRQITWDLDDKFQVKLILDDIEITENFVI